MCGGADRRCGTLQCQITVRGGCFQQVPKLCAVLQRIWPPANSRRADIVIDNGIFAASVAFHASDVANTRIHIRLHRHALSHDLPPVGAEAAEAVEEVEAVAVWSTPRGASALAFVVESGVPHTRRFTETAHLPTVLPGQTLWSSH